MSAGQEHTRLLFVYGTLRRGQANSHFLEPSEYLGEARTTAEYRLLDLGPFPAMVAGGRDAVPGELYRVTRATLAATDRLEGHPHFYRRQEVELEDGRRALTYLLADGPRLHPRGKKPRLEE